MKYASWEFTDNTAEISFLQPTEPSSGKKPGTKQQDPGLSINSLKGTHWSKSYKKLNPWKTTTATFTRILLKYFLRDWEKSPVVVSVTLSFRTGARRDPHNYTSTVVKSVVDGLVAGRLIPDDTADWVTVQDPILIVSDRNMATVRLMFENPPWRKQ